MLIPTPQDISKIIKKLKVLKKVNSDFQNRVSVISDDQRTDTSADEIAEKFVNGISNIRADQFYGEPIIDKGLSVEEQIRAAIKVGRLRDTKRAEEKILRHFRMDSMSRAENTICRSPVNELRRLLDEVMPKIYSEIKAKDRHGVLTEEGKRLAEIRSVIDRELSRREQWKASGIELITGIKKIEELRKRRAAFEKEAPKHLLVAKPIKEEIDKLLHPWWPYLRANSSWGKREKKRIEEELRAGNLDAVIHELEKVRYNIQIGSNQKSESQVKAGQGKTKIRGNKAGDIKKLFRFNKSQAFFDEKDLGLPTGAEINPAEILKKLVKSFGKIVPYKELDENSGNIASDFLRGKIRVIRRVLERNKVPCKIEPKKWAGYILKSSRSHS